MGGTGNGTIQVEKVVPGKFSLEFFLWVYGGGELVP